MTRVTEVFGLPSATGLLNEHSDEFITDDMVGVEVELEGLMSIALLRGMVDPRWGVVEDGSLRNMGAEFVFKEPMFGKDVSETLRSLESMFAMSGVTPRTGERTSVHVHLDVRDLSYTQLLNLILVYLLCEPYFFAVGGEERRNSPYSFPLAETDDYLNRIGMAMSDPSSHTFSNNITDSAKYSAFNIAPVATQGSVEFRHHKGTYNAEALVRWVNMVLCVKRYVNAQPDLPMTPEDIDDILNSGFDSFIDEVFEGVDVPRGLSGWDNAARVAKRVSQRVSGTDNIPLMPGFSGYSDNHPYIVTQRNVAGDEFILADPEVFVGLIQEYLGEDGFSSMTNTRHRARGFTLGSVFAPPLIEDEEYGEDGEDEDEDYEEDE